MSEKKIVIPVTSVSYNVITFSAGGWNNSWNRTARPVDVDKVLKTGTFPCTINGYEYSRNPVHMSEKEYDSIVEVWKNAKEEEMTLEEFSKLCSTEFCTEWSKFNEYGEYYTDFFKSRKDDSIEEFRNARDMTFEKNVKALYELPYPLEVIVKVVKISCGQWVECVSYTNIMCETVKNTYGESLRMRK